VARYVRRIRRRGDPVGRWLTFLQNHREVIAAFDFFTVPTVTFQVLYCFSVIEHGRRRILHFNVTRHPTAEWVVQQLREAFKGPVDVASVAFGPDDARLAIVDKKNGVRVWDMRTGNPITPTLPHESTLTVVGFSPEGKELVNATTQGVVRLAETACPRSASRVIRPCGRNTPALGCWPSLRARLSAGREPPYRQP
jgi:WD40 repeat protein